MPMQILTKEYAVLLVCFMLFTLFGCAGTTAPQVFMRPEFNKEYVRKVAVLPFEDIAGNSNIAARCRQITITQTLSSGLFDVVDKMQVDSLLKQEAIQPGTPINVSTLRRLGQLLDVQAFLIGSLDEAGESQKGAAIFLELSMTMRLVDAESGLVLWQASGRNSGYSWWDRLFGLGGEDSFQVTLGLVRNLLRTIR
jgi:TolB-like protein